MNIKKIAQISGYSTATVSRVLNNKPGVSQATREKIENIIKEYDYVPNKLARNLSNQSSNFIAVIIPDIQNNFFADIIRGISSVINESNLSILLFDTNENSTLEHKFINDLYELNVLGLIITPVSEDNDVTKNLINRLIKKNILVVQVDRKVNIDNLDGIFVENFRGAELATQQFIHNNHKDIAVITGPESSKPGRERLEGYLSSLTKNNIPITPDYIKYGNFKSSSGYENTQVLLKSEKPPTAILCMNNMMTIGALRYLHENQYEIGKDISLIGFDEIEILTWLGISLTVIKRPTTIMGIKAAELLLYRINNSNSKHQHIYLPVELITRGSESYEFR